MANELKVTELFVPVQASITANTGSTQGTGEDLTSGINNVATCANVGDAVTMPTAEVGLEVTIRNAGANACDVFPFLGDQLNASGANTAESLAAGANITYLCLTTALWFTKT
jgi:hypothetical protein